jgi:uncharacterized protein YndB with AHSA1/START domain
MSDLKKEVDVNVRDRILKPVNEVFAAFIDPAKMSQYFISGASGPMKAGTKVQWEFADVGAKVLIDVLEVEENRRIVYEGASCGTRSRITIQLRADDPNTTVVTINEAKFPMDHAGVKRAMGQTAGWTYTLACLKAYLQFGINLRLGLNKRLTDVSEAVS